MMEKKLVSQAFKMFLEEAPQHAKAWMEMVQQTAAGSALDEKTQALAYLSVLAAVRLTSGIPFHVAHAKKAGASRAEIISAILVGLPAAGHVVTHALPVALDACDSQEMKQQ